MNTVVLKTFRFFLARAHHSRFATFACALLAAFFARPLMQRSMQRSTRVIEGEYRRIGH